MIPQSLSKSIHRFHLGRCFYCGHETWHRSEGIFICHADLDSICARFSVDADTPKKRIKLARHLQGTIEHLIRKMDGGSDDISNLVLGCHFCNVSRDDRSPEEHMDAIWAMIQDGQHPFWRNKPIDDVAIAMRGFSAHLPHAKQVEILRKVGVEDPEVHIMAGHGEMEPIECPICLDYFGGPCEMIDHAWRRHAVNLDHPMERICVPVVSAPVGSFRAETP